MFSEVSPIWFALTSAVLFALGAHFQNLGLAQVKSDSGAAISIASSAVLYWLLAPFLLVGANWSQSALWIFVAIGLFRPTESANLAVAGMRYLGPTLVSTLSSTSPLFGAALGVLWLGEILTWTTALGTLGIIAAVVALADATPGLRPPGRCGRSPCRSAPRRCVRWRTCLPRSAWRRRPTPISPDWSVFRSRPWSWPRFSACDRAGNRYRGAAAGLIPKVLIIGP